MANDRTGAMTRAALAAGVVCAVLTLALPCFAGPPAGPDPALQSLQGPSPQDQPAPAQPPQATPPTAGLVLTADDTRPRDGRNDRPRPQGPRNGPPPGPQPGRAQPGRDARGQTLQPQQRGQPLGDYRRYRLRTPPPGYSWRRVGDEAYLVSDETGTVTETVPVGR